MLVYKIDVLKALKERGYNQNVLQKEKLIASLNIQKIRKGVMVGNIALNKICELLQCQPGDVISYVPDGSTVTSVFSYEGPGERTGNLTRQQTKLIGMIKSAPPDNVDLILKLMQKLEKGER